jgi:hypothetical protein
MLGVFSEFERAMIQARVKAGLERAKQEQMAGKVRRDASLGHRISFWPWLKSRNSTLADRSDGHLRLHRHATKTGASNLHHLRGR